MRGRERRLETMCESCNELRLFVVFEEDPGSCRCTACGRVQVLMEPLRF